MKETLLKLVVSFLCIYAISYNLLLWMFMVHKLDYFTLTLWVLFSVNIGSVCYCLFIVWRKTKELKK